MTPDPRTLRHPSSRAGAAIVLWGFLLLALCAAAVTVTAVQQLRVLARQEAQARAQLVADALAGRVQHAVALGIPLSRLEGVEALFAQRMQGSRDIAAIVLATPDGQPMWLRAAGESPALPAGPQATSPVRLGGVPVANVLIVWWEPDPLGTLGRWALPLAAWLLAVGVLASELLRWTWARGLRRRDAQVLSASARIGQGDLTWRLPSQRRREFDPRTSWLSAELRHVNELYVRVHRLVHSLRQTEPEAPRRAELEVALQDATGGDRFRLDTAPSLLDAPYERDARRWQGIIGGLLAWIAAGALVAGLDMGWLQPSAAAILAGAALLSGLAWLAWSWRLADRRAWARGLGTGLLLIGPGLTWPWIVVSSALDLVLDPRISAGLLALSCLAGLSFFVSAWRSGRRAKPAPAALAVEAPGAA